MKKLLIVPVCVLLGSFSSVAFAGDSPSQESRFSGLYAGAFVGAGGASFDGSVDTSETLNGFPEESETFGSEHENGAVFGGYLGYNIVRDSWLYGVEVDLGVGNIDGKAQDLGGNDYAEHEIDAFASLRARLGRVFNDTTLLYATGGVGYIRSEFTATSTGDPDPRGKEDFDSFGFVGGLGLEHMLTEKINIRAEALYFDSMSEHGFKVDELHDDMDAGDEASIDNFYQIRLGLAYHF